MSERNKPDLVVRDGSLKATVWSNDGENGRYQTVTLAKTYEDSDGKLRDTSTFYASELPRIVELGRETYGKIKDLRRDQRREREPDQTSDQVRDSFRQRRNKRATLEPDRDRDERR